MSRLMDAYTKKYEPTDEERRVLDSLMAKHNICFSGCQAFQHCKNSYGFLRRFYGDIKLCIVRFWSTRLLVQQAYTEYTGLFMRPIFDPDPNRIRVLLPRLECIDGEQEGWEKQVAKFVRSDGKKTLVVMEGIVWYEEAKLHYKRIFRILEVLDALRLPSPS
jgi:hypothetical protein